MFGTVPAGNSDQVCGVTMPSRKTSVLTVLEVETLIENVFTGASQEAAAWCEAIIIAMVQSMMFISL